MQGKVPLPPTIAVNAMQAEEPSQIEVDIARERAQAAAEAELALRNWTGWKKDLPPVGDFIGVSNTDIHHPLNSPAEGGTAAVYLAGVSARPARERQQLKPRVVQLITSSRYLVESAKGCFVRECC